MTSQTWTVFLAYHRDEQPQQPGDAPEIYGAVRVVEAASRMQAHTFAHNEVVADLAVIASSVVLIAVLKGDVAP
jgi:hypothetical protein